jgi:hypothetical protein
MLAPLGATVAVVLFVVAVALTSTAAGLPVVVAFCGKQADCAAAVVVTFVSLLPAPIMLHQARVWPQFHRRRLLP